MTDPSTPLEVKDGAEITGGTPVQPRLTNEELALCFEVYETWRAAGVVEVTCSEATFLAHLNYEQLWAGPWKWNIVGMAYGDVKMYGVGGRFLGTMTVSNLKMAEH